MLNIVVPITNKFDKYREMLSFMAKTTNTNVFLGVTSEFYATAIAEYGEFENFDFYEFDNGTNKESIINTLQDYLMEGAIMVLRKPLNKKEFEKIVNSDRDVVTAKVVRSKFKAWLHSTWQKISKLILGVREYAGEPSIVYFNEDLADVVVNSNNLSYSSRVNRWKGIKQAVITIDSETDQRKNDVPMLLKYTLIAALLVAVAVTVTTLVAVLVPVSIVVVLLLVCLDAICVAVAFILVVMAIFTNMTGRKQQAKSIILNKKAKEIEIEEDEEE